MVGNPETILAGGAPLTHQDEFGWPILAGLVHARVGLDFITMSAPSTRVHCGCL